MGCQNEVERNENVYENFGMSTTAKGTCKYSCTPYILATYIPEFLNLLSENNPKL